MSKGERKTGPRAGKGSLRSFVERIEKLREADRFDDAGEVIFKAEAAGFDGRTLRTVLKERRIARAKRGRTARDRAEAARARKAAYESERRRVLFDIYMFELGPDDPERAP
ncbi:MAG: DUF2312 domain-containing protein [Hyphomicrobiales bacterium]|nr:DUF2312 domain-containing protein [Hyphomicrobiales bacterium]